jgi:succinate dehydrogenase/fumarate reductase flavoprotein subunit
MKPPMTANEAREIVAEMFRVTSKRARVRMWQTAIRIGNMTESARDVYLAALERDEATP